MENILNEQKLTITSLQERSEKLTVQRDELVKVFLFLFLFLFPFPLLVDERVMTNFAFPIHPYP